jgi:hypothetical protein
MYYDASGTDYISTPSFAIPNTGILTIEAWMKSTFSATVTQNIIGDGNRNSTVGYIYLTRYQSYNDLLYYYAEGTTSNAYFSNNILAGFDNQWLHIVIVCDYVNKTGKFYRNGVQYGATYNLTGNPVFPSTTITKFIGSYNTNSNRLTDGSLDEVRIYNRGLSAEEVAAIYNQTKGKY